MGVEHRKIGDYDRHWKGYGQHPGQGAEGSHKHPRVRLGGHVAVAYGGHRDDGPPQTLWYALEAVILVVLQQTTP